MQRITKKTLLTTTCDAIDVFDGIFDADEQHRMHHFAGNSLFHTKGASSCLYEARKDFFLRSSFSESDIRHFGIFELENYKNFIKAYNIDFKPTNYWIVLSTHLSEYTYHADNALKGKRTLLYYMNTRWDKDWGGETMFCNRHGEVEIATEFRPGRVVMFDNHILHKPAPLSVSSIPYRFTFVATETD